MCGEGVWVRWDGVWGGCVGEVGRCGDEGVRVSAGCCINGIGFVCAS